MRMNKTITKLSTPPILIALFSIRYKSKMELINALGSMRLENQYKIAQMNFMEEYLRYPLLI